MSNKPPFISFMFSLGRDRGGMTRSLYDRMMHFSKDRDIIIALTGYQSTAREVFQELKDAGKIPQKTILRHLYEDISGDPAWLKARKEFQLPDFTKSPSLLKTETRANGRLDRYFQEDGVYRGLVNYRGDGSVKHVDYHNINHPQYVSFRDLVTVSGYVHARQYLDADFKPRYQINYTGAGDAYMSHWVSSSGHAYRVAVFRDGHEDIYPKREDLFRWWGAKLRSEYPDSVQISSKHNTVSALAGGDYSERGRSFAMIHVAHRKSNAGSPGEVKSWTSRYTEKGGVSRVILLTKTQERDFVKDFPSMKDKTLSIAHAAPEVEVSSVSSADRVNSVIYLGRLAPEKQVDQAIKAFKLALLRNRRLTLDIYGIGSEEKTLKRLVKKLKISKKVKFHGYTNDPLGVFANYGLQLVPSREEALGRVIQEGFSRGVPCIAYDVEYGPRELIKTGANGAVVERDDIKAAAKWINKITSKEARWERYSKAALDTARSNRREVWERRWDDLVDG